jgi:hypothetical protein
LGIFAQAINVGYLDLVFRVPTTSSWTERESTEEVTDGLFIADRVEKEDIATPEC